MTLTQTVWYHRAQLEQADHFLEPNITYFGDMVSFFDEIALGLLELTHGYEMYGSTLLEMAVKSQPKLTPVLRWRRVRCARAAHLVAGAGRVRKMRESLRSRFEV